MRKGRTVPVTEDEKKRKAKSQADNAQHLYNALQATITHEWQTYDIIHRQVNVFMRNATGNRIYDIEFINLNVGLRIFSKSNPIEWKEERHGIYQSQRTSYIRLKGGDNEK